MHLVTGRAGSAHINSDMVGRFNAGTIGDGAYILNTQNKMICTVVDANHVTIATGDAVVQGRHVTNESAVTLTIQSGGQGVSRHDLVCIRYTNNSGIESAELVVVAGTPSAAPVDPSYNDGSILDGDTPVDIPLYRLVIDGINLESVDALAETIEPFTTKPATTDWAYLTGNASSTDKYMRWRVKNDVVYVEWYYTSGAGIPANSSKRFGGIPAEYCPDKNMAGAAFGTGNNVQYWELYHDSGSVFLGTRSSSSADRAYGSFSYPLN